ncbi:MAG: hypothetical protein U0575_10035 [Phycisphaerales bacterium]
MRNARLARSVRLVPLAALLSAGGCTNFVTTGTSDAALHAVREAMTRAGATEEAKVARVDLEPEELELTFLRYPPEGSRENEPRTIVVRIVPWGDAERRQRTIVIDTWRWHGAPPMWGGSAKEAQTAVNRAMNEVLAEAG